MEHSIAVKVGTVSKIILECPRAVMSIKLFKTRVDVDSPVPFKECDVEFVVIEPGVYAVNIPHTDIGDILYKVVPAGDKGVIFRYKVVEKLDTDIINDAIIKLNTVINNMEDGTDDDLVEIKDMLNLINARI